MYLRLLDCFTQTLPESPHGHENSTPQTIFRIYVCTYICRCAYIYIYIYIYICIHLSLYLSLSIYIYIHICIYVYTHTYVCIYT